MSSSRDFGSNFWIVSRKRIVDCTATDCESLNGSVRKRERVRGSEREREVPAGLAADVLPGRGRVERLGADAIVTSRVIQTQ